MTVRLLTAEERVAASVPVWSASIPRRVEPVPVPGLDLRATPHKSGEVVTVEVALVLPDGAALISRAAVPARRFLDETNAEAAAAIRATPEHTAWRAAEVAYQDADLRHVSAKTEVEATRQAWVKATVDGSDQRSFRAARDVAEQSEKDLALQVWAMKDHLSKAEQRLISRGNELRAAVFAERRGESGLSARREKLEAKAAKFLTSIVGELLELDESERTLASMESGWSADPSENLPIEEILLRRGSVLDLLKPASLSLPTTNEV